MTMGPPRHRPQSGPDDLSGQDLDGHCSDRAEADELVHAGRRQYELNLVNPDV